MEQICLDTDVVVDFLRNNEEAVTFVKQHEATHSLAITSITLFELYYGAYKSTQQKKNIQAVELLSKHLHLLNLSNKSVKLAGKVLATLEKKGTPIDFRDLLIGTIAATNNFSMKTGNLSHFEKIEGLKIL